MLPDPGETRSALRVRWDNMPDVRLTRVMLRALWLGLAPHGTVRPMLATPSGGGGSAPG